MTTEQKLTAEQAALLSGASAVDSAVAPTITFDEQGNEIPPPEENRVDPVKRNRDLLNLALKMLSPALPFLPDIYTTEVVDDIASAFTAVEIKRGWDVQKYVNEELVLVAAVVPPTIAAVICTTAYIAAVREQNAAAKKNPETFAKGLGDGS